MEAALAAGSTIVNDISALRYDDRAMDVVVQAGCPVVLMHAPSAKSDPHEGGTYAHVLFDVHDMLAERIAAFVAAGIDPAKIIVDPGLGFGKGVGANLALINGIALFHSLGCPILFVASRHRMIGALDNAAPSAPPLPRTVACVAAGIDPAKIIVDPGLGFGKGVGDNLALINGIALFHSLGCPILFGASRKRMIGALDNEAPADQRLGGTVALHYQAATQGAQLLRVHDIAENRQALRVWRGLRDAALTG